MSIKKDLIRVLILGVGGGSHGLEIMKALCFSKLSYYICAADMDRRSLGIFQADKGYVVPPASSSRYISAVLDICRKERIQVVFHGSEPDLKKLSNNRAIFEERDIFLPFNSSEVINLCSNKEQTFDMLKSLGVPIPRTIAVRNKRDIVKANFFPAIVKPYVGSGGSKDTFIAQNRQELLFFCEYILRYKGKPLIQEYIGTPEEEYTVGILSDREGAIISSIAIRRFITSSMSNRYKIRPLKDKGDILAISSGISQGEVVNNVPLLKQCRQIARKLKSEGPLNIQCRFIDKKVCVFEINPRFSGTTYMRALAGINEPDLLIRKYLLHNTIPKKIVAKNGLVLRELKESFISSPKYKKL